MKLTKWMSFLFIAGVIASCYPEKDRTIEDFDLVGTRFADNVNFDDYKTYHLYDSVVIVYDTTEEKPDYPKEEADIIISGIRQNMMNYGWVEVAQGDTPDVYLEAAVWTNKIVGASYYPGWGYPGWGWNPWWGYPGWGVSYYSYTTGTVLMSMMDVKNYDYSDKPAQVIWTGGLNGLVSSSNNNNLSRIEYSVNQAFTQSAYLNKK
ncbi:DUF4136 domain-containing protein [bacterium SCSIO 12643]|nr:DUF4136 domain-containing protein [bacterium SCSIO 12643]